MNHLTRYLTILLILMGIESVQADTSEFSSGARQNTLLELYTSEGCSSCPPADRWLGKLLTHPQLWQRVVPVAFHVDYWNYLGWRDIYSSPNWSQRQRDYAAKGYARSVYTPGFFVNGREWRGWFKRRDFPLSQAAETGVLRARIVRNNLIAQFRPTAQEMQQLTLHVSILGFDLNTEVASGENAGKKLVHHFVTLHHQALNAKPGKADWTWQTDLPQAVMEQVEAKAIALWVVPKNDLTVLQATGGWIK